MRFFVVILLVNLFSSSGRAKKNEVVGPANTLIILHPYHVAFEYGNHTICQGAVISYFYVLTAARCMVPDIENLRVRAGTHERGRGGSLHRVSEFIRHDGFSNVSSEGYDIAVVRVYPHFESNDTLQPIPMFQAGRWIETDSTSVVSSFGASADRLQQFTSSVVERKLCFRRYGRIPPGTFCSGHRDEYRRVCDQDAGAPVAFGDQLAGIVSYAKGCNQSDHPLVITEVAVFRSWIHDKVNF